MAFAGQRLGREGSRETGLEIARSSGIPDWDPGLALARRWVDAGGPLSAGKDRGEILGSSG